MYTVGYALKQEDWSGTELSLETVWEKLRDRDIYTKERNAAKMNQIWIFFTWSLVWTCCWSFNNRYNHNNDHDQHHHNQQDEYDYQLDYHRPRDRQIALQLQAKAVENQGKSLLREAGDIGT